MHAARLVHAKHRSFAHACAHASNPGCSPSTSRLSTPLHSLRICSALAVPAFAETAPVADRVAQQNKLFDEFYETGLKNSPERATAYGDYRYNALLGQYSLAEIARQHAEADDFLKRLKAISTDGMGDKDLLSHRLHGAANRAGGHQLRA